MIRSTCGDVKYLSSALASFFLYDLELIAKLQVTFQAVLNAAKPISSGCSPAPGSSLSLRLPPSLRLFGQVDDRLVIDNSYDKRIDGSVFG